MSRWILNLCFINFLIACMNRIWNTKELNQSFLPFVGGLSLIPRSQGGGNILINSSNIYPMDCDPPSVISIQPSVQMTLTPSTGIPSSGGSTSVSLNVINQRYLQQHMHNSRSGRYNPPITGHVQKSSYAPASLPIDLIANSSGMAANSAANSIMVLPDHHLNASSLIINSSGSYHHPFGNDGNSIQLTHQNKAGGSSGRSGNTNSNNSNNNSTGDESMVGVCVQQSPVVTIH